MSSVLGGGLRFLLRVSVWLLAGSVLALVFLVLIAIGDQSDFRPVAAALPREELAFAAHTANDLRPVEASYLSFPEWYLVFNPQEYARILATHPASDFPYFESIGQFWFGYAQVYAVTRHGYPFDSGDHLMDMVIGISTTIEYAAKGLYEGSIGRLSEWSASGRTAEEDYAATVAKDYGDFVPTQPWFDFPFGKALKGLWTGTGLVGVNMVRKCERKFALSLEYGVKWGYASLIRLASHAVYGLADDKIYATLRARQGQPFALAGLSWVKKLKKGSWIVTLPHYQGFTDTAPKLAARGADFLDVAGNSEILLTLCAPEARSFDLAPGRRLFSMEMLASPGVQRVAVQVPVKSLGAILRRMKAEGLALEHLYDY
jgi:hypothetical protein